MNDKKPQQTSADVLTEISAVIASMDGISTGDAFKLGGLVKRYGELCGSDALKPMLETMIDALGKPPKEPWERGPLG